MGCKSTSARTHSVSIDCPAKDAYEFLSLPENFPQWASWIVKTPEGPASVRFTERNSHGVLDHSVRLPGGESIYIPLRLVASGERCELALTLFRPPGVSDEKLAADAEWVMRDLRAAKRILEALRIGECDEAING